MDKLKILGIPIEVGSRSNLFYKCSALVGNGGVICTPNPLILSRSVENASLRDALLSADLCIPDGIGLLSYLRRVDKKADTLPGVDLGRMLVKSRSGLSLGLVGGVQGRAGQAFSFLRAQTKDLCSAFCLNGYDTSIAELLSCLKTEKPDLCFVCLGSPRQEIIMRSLREYSPKTLFLGLGGSLDVYSGHIARAPRAVRSLHLEWLYRMCREPRRFRDLPILLRFPFLCTKYREENNKVTKNGVAWQKN